MRTGKYEASDSNSAGTAVTFLLIGLGAGTLLGMLLAPKAGKQMRKELRRKFDNARETVDDWTDEAKEFAEEAMERGAEIADQVKEESSASDEGNAAVKGRPRTANESWRKIWEGHEFTRAIKLQNWARFSDWGLLFGRKAYPQRLKPHPVVLVAARLKSCPSLKSAWATIGIITREQHGRGVRPPLPTSDARSLFED